MPVCQTPVCQISAKYMPAMTLLSDDDFLLKIRDGVLEDVLGLKAYKSSKMSCPRFEDSIVFYWLKKKIIIQKTTQASRACQLVSFPYLKNCQVMVNNILNGVFAKALIGA